MKQLQQLARWLLLACTLGAAMAAGATAYPLRVVDVAGRSVVVAKPPHRIFIQNGNTLTALALLEREDPFARIAAWNNTLGRSDPSLWQLMQQRWPRSSAIPTLDFDNSGHVDLEALVRLRPDLVLLDIEARPAVEGRRAGALLAQLRIPVLYLDISRDPVVNLPKTVALLGRVLDREARADAYLQFYRQRLAALQAAVAQEPRRPRVFIESRAGRMGLEQCCYSQGKTAWGHLIEAVGGVNIASQLLPGLTGDISLETLIRLQPDVYLMTGTSQVKRGAQTIPFGYGAAREDAEAALARLMRRPGFGLLNQGPASCVHAVYHQFYDSAFHIVALEYLAKMLYPQHFAELRPQDTYRQLLRTFTSLPDAPFIFDISRNFADLPCSAQPAQGTSHRPHEIQ